MTSKTAKFVVAAVAFVLVSFMPLQISNRPAVAGSFGAFTADVKPADVFPGAEKFGPFEGTPKAAAAFKDGRIAGYVFEASDIGYSGKPIRLLVGLSNDGLITGAKVMEHHEPILLVGISPEKLFDFVGRLAGQNIIALSKDAASKKVDVVSGATVTAVVINDSVMRTAMAVARSRGLAGFAPLAKTNAATTAEPQLADVTFAAADWSKLLGDGLIHRLHLTNADVDTAFAKIGVGSPEPYAKAGIPENDFIDLYAALVSLESVGRSLLAGQDYQNLRDWLASGQSALLLAGNGDYSFRGSGFVRGGIFDRIQVVQDDVTILFKDKDYKKLDQFSAGAAPDFNEVALFRIPAGSRFNPAKPFRVELLAQRPTGPTEKAFTSFSLRVELPQRFVKMAPETTVAEPSKQPASSQPAGAAEQEPIQDALWLKIWHARAFDIAVLAVALTLLTAIFFFQDWLVKRPVLFARLRTGFLLFSVVWLGLYAKAQLSVVNVLTFVHALTTGFSWHYFLLEPLIFMLWCGVAVSLLFWGRGGYCGWLCPFGSLQELLNHAARRLGIQQYPVPQYLHERMWALKYILFLGLLGVSLGDMAQAEQLAEVEPFKTVVLLRFAREWYFVAFALSLLVAGLFIERFYCRYLCVLGAALAIPGRGRMFDWLKRRKQCGYECQLCAKNCMVQAIHPLGQINPNECLNCMHCQVIYWDDHQCPPLVMKREGRGKKSAAKAAAGQAQASTSGTSTSKGPAPIQFTLNSKETANG